MSTTANIDLISSTSASVNSTSSSKTFADNSSDFSNILDNANKVYASDKEPIKDSSDKNTTKSTKTSDKANNTKNTNINQKVNEKEENSQEKLSNNTSNENSKNTTNKISETTENSQPEVKPTDNLKDQSNPSAKLDNENEAEVSAESKKLTASAEEVPVLNTNSDTTLTEKVITDFTPTTPSKETTNILPPDLEIKTVEVTNPIKTETLQKEPKSTESNSNMTDKTDINIAVTTENILEILGLNVKVTDPKAITDINSNNSNNNSNITNQTSTEIGQEVESQVVQSDFSVNLDNLTKNITPNKTPQTNTIKAQINIEPQGRLNPQIQPELQMSQPKESESIISGQNDVQAPVIEVNTEIIASDVNTDPNNSDIKQNIKNILNKTSLNQEVLDKLNAKITSVESSNSPNSGSTNLPASQNTNEQIIKLTIESDNKNTINIDNITPSVTNETPIQQDFNKIMENVQQQGQPQTTKTLSDNEILSQINNKLNTLKDEGTTKINIVLKPENLGKVNLELINTKEGLTAQMTTDNPQVKEILDKSLDSLKNSLNNQGVNVNSVSVKVEEPQKHQQNDMLSFSNGQSNTGYQESSNNSQPQNPNGVPFDEEIDSIVNQTNPEEEIISETENTVSVDSYTGKVDYKV